MLKILCTVLLVLSSSILLVACRSYNNGLIFYNLENHNTYLPPTISVSRGRGLAKFKYSARGSIWSTFGKPCDCEGPLCGCCVGIKVKQYNFDQKMCANVSYVRPKDEIQMEVFLNDTATAKYGIAARNPSPLCVPIMMGIPMSMCVQMSNIAVQGDNLNMCMDFLVRLASTQLFEMHFQCMKVGLQGASWVGPDGQPVIPASESKIKDRGSNESEEYYDESEAEEENEIISKEKEEQKESVAMHMKEEDLNKAEEEMDDSDIRDKIMDIVKEQEKEEEEIKESSELMKDNEIESLSPMQDHSKVEEIVTNIMESINEGKGSAESDKYITMPIVVENVQPSEISNMESAQESNVLSDPLSLEAEESNMESIMETNALVEEDFQINSPNNNEENKKESHEMTDKPLEKESDSLKLEINDLKDSTVNVMEMEESNEIIKDNESLQDLPNTTMKAELHLEDLFENSQEKDMQIENNVEQPEKDMKETNMQFEQNIVKETNMEMLEDTTEPMSNDYETGKIEKFEMLINNEGAEDTTEISQIANEQNNFLENLQQPMETSTERLMAANLKPTMPQIAATTSETDSIDSIDNTLTTATIMTTTTTTTTTTATATKKPTATDKNSAVAVTFIENTDDDEDKTNNKAEEDDDDEDDNDGDNSQENDSDYDDEEESEESEDETTEKGIQTNDAITSNIVMPTTAALNHKESSITQKLPNAYSSNESNSNDETNENTKDEFEAVEEQEEEIADDVETESNEQSENENDAEEEYDDEYEDYETTTVAVSDTKINSANDTCCKSATPAGVINDMQAAVTTNEQLNDNTNTAVKPQTNTVATNNNNLQFVSHDNTIPISNSDSNMLNVESTTNKMSQITINPAAATIAVSSTTTTSSNSNNALPLPLARKLYAHHHQQQLQQQQQQHHHHHYQQYHRHSRQQRQHYV